MPRVLNPSWSESSFAHSVRSVFVQLVCSTLPCYHYFRLSARGYSSMPKLDGAMGLSQKQNAPGRLAPTGGVD